MAKNITLIKLFPLSIFCIVYLGFFTQCNKRQNAQNKEDNSPSAAIISTSSSQATDLFADHTKAHLNDSTSQNSIHQFELKIIKTEGLGWGYDLYQKGKIYIHQPTIPAISGIKGFNSETEATLVGNLVIQKLNKDGQLPTISMNELDSLKIQY